MADHYQLTPRQIADLVERIPLASRSIIVHTRRHRQFERSVAIPGFGLYGPKAVLRLAGMVIEPNDAVPVELAICVGASREVVGVMQLPPLADVSDRGGKRLERCGVNRFGPCWEVDGEVSLADSGVCVACGFRPIADPNGARNG